MSDNTSFTFEYVVSLLVTIAVAASVNAANPKLNKAVTFGAIPLIVAYIVLTILNKTLPNLNKKSSQVRAYIENNTLNQIDKMGYIQVFPPLLGITLIVFVLLFTNNLV